MANLFPVVNVCENVSEVDQTSHLKPDPEDCTKYFKCEKAQNVIGGYIAYSKECPPNMGFDTKLKVCNYLDALPCCDGSNSIKTSMNFQATVSMEVKTTESTESNGLEGILIEDLLEDQESSTENDTQNVSNGLDGLLNDDPESNTEKYTTERESNGLEEDVIQECGKFIFYFSSIS